MAYQNSFTPKRKRDKTLKCSCFLQQEIAHAFMCLWC